MNKLLILIFTVLFSFNTAQARFVENTDRPLSPPVSTYDLEDPDDLDMSLPPEIEAEVLDTIKTVYADMVDQITEALTLAKSQMASLPLPADSPCKPENNWQDPIDYLESQNQKIQSATSLADITTLINETAAYLESYQETISDYAQEYYDCAFKSALESERAFLNSSKSLANVKKVKGENMDDVLEEIFAAMALVDQSESIYDNASNDQDKIEAFKVLADTVPYLQSIYSALYA
jgi:hypothetical protein